MQSCKVIVIAIVSTCSLPQVFLLAFCSPPVFCSANRWCGLRHPPLFQLHPVNRKENSLWAEGQSARVNRKTGKMGLLAISVLWMNVADLVAGRCADGGAENVALLPHALNVPHAIRNHRQVDCSRAWRAHLFITLKKWNAVYLKRDGLTFRSMYTSNLDLQRSVKSRIHIILAVFK